MATTRGRVAPAPAHPGLVDGVVDGSPSQSDKNRHVARLSHTQRAFLRSHVEAGTPVRRANELVQLGEHRRLGYVMASVLLLMAFAGVLALNCSCSVASALAAGCGLVALACAVGLGGICRLPADLLVDLDGIETTGQHMLQAYFHGAWIAMSLVVLPTGSLFLLDAEMTCPDATGHDEAKLAAIVAYATVLPLLASVPYCVRIVTTYEMAQSLQELCCLWTMTGSILVAVAAAMAQNRMTFLSASVELASDSAFWVTVACACGVLQVPLSAWGFYAGLSENTHMLKVHVLVSLPALCALTLASLLLATAFTGDAAVLDDQCAAVLRLMGADWFDAFFACAKYLPHGQGSLSPPVCERLGVDPPASKAQTSVAWELAAAGHGGTGGADGLATCALGCVDVGCCDKVKSALFVLENLIAVGGVWFLLIMGVGLWSSHYLFQETKRQHSPILHHRRSLCVGVAIAGTACVGVGALLGALLGDSFTTMPAADRAGLCDFDIGLPTLNDSVPVASCGNGVLDGLEVGVDCGGPHCSFCDSRGLEETPMLSSATPSHAPSQAPSRAPSRAPSHAPSGSGSAAPTTNQPSPSPSEAPTLSPTAGEVPSIQVSLRWNRAALAGEGGGEEDMGGGPRDLDLKVRFLASEDQLCSLAGLDGVNSRCGGAVHSGDAGSSGDAEAASATETASASAEETISVVDVVKSLYVFYVENRLLDRQLAASAAHLHVRIHVRIHGVEDSVHALPPAVPQAFDLLGLQVGWDALNASLSADATGSAAGAAPLQQDGDIGQYAFARVVCVDARGSSPTVFACPQYFLASMEHRAHDCEASTTCKGCLPPLAASSWWEASEATGATEATAAETAAAPERTVRTCQPPDEDLGLVAAPPPSPDASPAGLLPGWLLDPADDSDAPRSCNDVCGGLNRTCSTAQMQTVSDAGSCRAAFVGALRGWCSAQDLQYTFSTDSYSPRAGGAMQLAARSNHARCLCNLGIWPNEPNDADEADSSASVELVGLAVVHAVMSNASAVFEDPGATCSDADAVLSVSGQTVDLTTLGSYVVDYECCSEGQIAAGAGGAAGAGSACAFARRVVVVDDGTGDCEALFAGFPVTTDAAAQGGCTVSGKLFAAMNNDFVGFPDPEGEVYYSNVNFPFAGACGELPYYRTDRRVCYCE